MQFTITDVGSEWVPTTVRHDVAHGARREVVLSRVGVLLAPEVAAGKRLDRRGHPLDASGSAILPTGFDPRDERPVEILGWIERSAADREWTIKTRVNTTCSLHLTLEDSQGRVVRFLAAGTFEPGGYAIPWDGTGAGSQRLRPAAYSLIIESGAMREVVPFIDTSLSTEPGNRGPLFDREIEDQPQAHRGRRP